MLTHKVTDHSLKSQTPRASTDVQRGIFHTAIRCQDSPQDGDDTGPAWCIMHEVTPQPYD